MSKPEGTDEKSFKQIAWLLFGILIVASVHYAYRWHTRGDSFAQAEGSLLSFGAAMLSAFITLIFVFYTRKSLKEAQRSNNLQWKQWLHTLEVKPKIWFAFTGRENSSHKVDFISPDDFYGDHDYSSAPQLVCCIWNPGTQSFRVIGTQCFLIIDRLVRFDLKQVGLVIAPHAVTQVDLTDWIVALLFRHSAPQDDYDKSKMLNPTVQIGCVLRYQDWASDERMTEEFRFTIDTAAGIDKLSLSTDHVI